MWLARTASLAAACGGLGWAGHITAGQGDTTLTSLPAATLFSGILLARFTRREWGFGEIFAVLATAQIGLHLLFQLGAPTTVVTTPEHGTHLVGTVVGYSPGMLVGHLWAALLTAALLSHGEAALWTLFDILTSTLPTLYRPWALHLHRPTGRFRPPSHDRVLNDAPPAHHPRGPPRVQSCATP
ncbi:hypothetical protein Nans01_18800 [Nocardiopsis ansamitocini]|uniref:Uncharacterized protein n=1 Tax=Nocardiopsis ansamitocini TaxID=1670832 RepID=A0A9W6P5P0_9ACTN|nr:hypothetical protein Nans01_18800 [Nocardiopsis ansamitocini]